MKYRVEVDATLSWGTKIQELSSCLRRYSDTSKI